MKTIKGIILGLILAASLTYAYTYTYTNEQIQALLDLVNDRVGVSAGAGDEGKLVKLDATGKLDSSLLSGLAGSGTVDTSGTPVASDFAKFTDADTIEGRSYSETRSDLSLVPGTNIQAYDADLTTYAGITPSANVQSLLGAANYSAMRTQLSLVPGTNIQVWDEQLDNLAAISYSSNMYSFLAAANYAAMRTLLDLEPNTDFYAPAGTDVAVTDGGTGRSTSTTAYGLIAAGTTATGALQTLAAGATTEILVGGGAAALPVWTTATGTGAPVRAGSPDFTGSPTVATSIDPDAADGATIGSATKEWSDLYLSDGAVIYGQADQSNTITSSAGGWSFNIFPITPSAAPDADYEVANKKYVDDAVVDAGAGDVTGVGDCASGACLDGSSDGGSYIRLYDGDSNYGEIQIPDIAGDIVITTPSTTSTLLAVNGDGSALTSVDAATGDSATAFFDAGTIEHERGGLEADVNAYSGLVGITGGATTEVNTAAELETFAGLGAFANEYLDDANQAAMQTTLGLGTGDSPQFLGINVGAAADTTIAREGAGDITIEGNHVYRAGGTDVADADVADNITITNISQVQDITATASEINTPLDGALVTLSEFQQLETIGATTISADQWVYVGSQDQGTYTTSAPTFATVNTGQGANELYEMDQDVKTTSDVSFATITATQTDFTGTHTGADDAATLTDSTASFAVDSLIGFSIENTTDGSDGIITDNDATTVTATLAGGTGDDWDNGDAYVIGIHGGTEIDLYPDTNLRCEMESGATVQVDTSPGFGGGLIQATDFNWDSADADSYTTPAVAIHCDPFGNTGVGKIMFKGHIRNDTWNWSAGWIYLGTDGLPTQTAPSGSGDIVQIIGRATSADTFYFNPSYYWNKLN